MIVLVRAFFLALVLCLPSVFAHPLTSQEALQGRDLSSYAAGGDYHATEPRQPSKQIPHIDRLRTFLWDHWHSKRRAYATLTESGIDTFWTTYIFIEPTEENKWHIVLRGVSPNIRRGPAGFVHKPNRVFDLPEVWSLSYARDEGDHLPGVPRAIVFLDKDGNEVWRL